VDKTFYVNGTGQSGTTPIFEVLGGTLTVLANGNVGIGTSNPTSLLQLKGPANDSGDVIDYQNRTSGPANYFISFTDQASQGIFLMTKYGVTTLRPIADQTNLFQVENSASSTVFD